MIQVRYIQPEDYDSVKTLISSIFPGAIIHITMDDTLLLAENEGKTVGFLHLVDRGDYILLQGLGVAKTMRNRGIATLLMESIVPLLRERSGTVYLKVKATSPAINLYQKYGFTIKKFGNEIHTLVWKPDN